MVQKTFEAKVTVAGSAFPIMVSVPASDIHQAKKMIEAQYKPRQWFSAVREKK